MCDGAEGCLYSGKNNYIYTHNTKRMNKIQTLIWKNTKSTPFILLSPVFLWLSPFSELSDPPSYLSPPQFMHYSLPPRQTQMQQFTLLLLKEKEREKERNRGREKKRERKKKREQERKREKEKEKKIQHHSEVDCVSSTFILHMKKVRYKSKNSSLCSSTIQFCLLQI